jgi:hypothetical protein
LIEVLPNTGLLKIKCHFYGVVPFLLSEFTTLACAAFSLTIKLFSMRYFNLEDFGVAISNIFFMFTFISYFSSFLRPWS